MTPFQLDPFQREAIEKIESGHSILVSAPTGAGKTLIAEAAMDRAMAQREKVIYTAPIKALSNQKYRDFRARYHDEVGILTGDVSIHPDAPVLIMTTEIYRNSLFSATPLGGSGKLFGGKDSGRLREVGWVIFDEIHYLDDPERGTVWEEAILFTPPQIKILALSATVPNVRQLGDWMRSVQNRPMAVIEENHRPVPLDFIFQCQGKFFQDLPGLRREGYWNRSDWRLSFRERRRGMRPMRAKPNRLDHLLRHLREKNHLPAIYFVFGRRRAELLACEAAQFDFLSSAEKKEISELYASLVERYDLKSEKSAMDLAPLVAQGIAVHHAGMLPTLKEIVEQLFTSRLIKMIFTTETFALGVNMPARSVVFDELEKFYGHKFQNLTTRDFYQMAGRAGRRGMDKQGTVYVRVHPSDIPFQEVERILYGRPEAIRSQLNTAYATLLNLYRDLGRRLLEIYPRSFHYFQSQPRQREEGLALIKRKLDLLEERSYLLDGGLSDKGEFASSIFGYELLLSEMHEDGVFEDLDERSLNLLLSGLVFEPRKGESVPRLTPRQERLRKQAELYCRNLHRLELKYRIFPPIKFPHFNLAQAVEAWTNGEKFEKLSKWTPVDEGELVRYFRMILQLLRELALAPHASERLRGVAQKARRLINRDVVDAERQLRV